MTSRRHSVTLRRKLLTWLLIPTAFIWLIGSIGTYRIALRFASDTYDRWLFDSTQSLAAQLRRVDGQITVDLPQAATKMLEFDAYDKIYYKVSGPHMHVIVGQAALPPPPPTDNPAGEAIFSDAKFHGDKIRIASISVPMGNDLILVQVAETMVKRTRVAQEILASVVLPQFLLIILAASVIWVGVERGLALLWRAQQAVSSRSPRDLRPVSEEGAPQELRLLLHAINTLMERLSQTLSSQQRFIADAAHQLRTPLAGLKTQTELALRQSDPADIHHSLENLHSGVEHTSRLATQLLSLARAEQRHSPDLPSQSIDMNMLVRDIVKEWVRAATRKDIDLGFVEAPQPAIIKGDPFFIREMLNNLLDNAIRYVQHGGTVTALVKSIENEIVVSVQDNGPGIPPEEIQRVFEPFHRVSGDATEGCGLGLTIVREIALAHGGNAWLEPDTATSGLVAIVSFPLAQ